MVKKFGKESDKELKDLELNDIYMQDNGDIIITAEEYYYKITQNGGSVSYFNNIISMKIDDTGKLVWSRNINKNQKSYDSYSSYGSVVKKDKVFFFFNASNKIKESKNGSVEFQRFKRKSAAIYCVIIDKDGKLNYKNIYEDKDSNLLFYTDDMIIDNEENIILLGDKKTQKRFLKIKY